MIRELTNNNIVNNQDIQLSTQRGAGMIEVVVALVILAIGLLGVLSMQSIGLGSNQRAIFTTEATFIASDMAERILASNSPNGAYNGMSSAAGLSGCGAACNTLQADSDALINAFTFNNANDLNNNNNVSLPGGQGTINLFAAPNTYDIDISWDEQRTGTVAVRCPNAVPRVLDPVGNFANQTCFRLRVDAQ
jgi:type IV pilus assembly protein PilV